MMKKNNENRRSFLKHILVGTAAVIGGAATGKPPKAEAATTPNRLDESLYYESESFKKYYKTLRS